MHNILEFQVTKVGKDGGAVVAGGNVVIEFEPVIKARLVDYQSDVSLAKQFYGLFSNLN